MVDTVSITPEQCPAVAFRMVFEGRVKSAIVLLLLTVFSGGVAAAQGSEDQDARRWEAYIRGGGSFIASEVGTGIIIVIDPMTGEPTVQPTPVKSAFAQTGRLAFGMRYRFTEMSSAEVGYEYSPNSFTEEQLETGFVLDSDIRMHFFYINYVRYFSRAARAQPYFTGGAGGVVFQRFAGFRNSKLALNFGGGVDIELSPLAALRLEYRVFRFERPAVLFGSLTSNGHVLNHAPSVGLAFRF